MPSALRTDALDFELPESLIATTPAEPRDSARLMVVHRADDRVEHRRVRDLPALGVLSAGDLVVVNRTRVLPAYFEGTRAGTGGRVTGLYLGADTAGRWSVLLESRGKPVAGERITLDAATQIELLERTGPGAWRAQPCDAKTGEALPADAALRVLERIGRPPLPPYIRRARKQLGLPEFTTDDPQRYNTVFAEDAGSVAAPTAGLHFTPELLQQLDAQGVRRAAVTLHVGIGTFAPVRSDTLDGHTMHAERYRVPDAALRALHDTRRAGGKILVVGTTTVRTLESLPHPLPHPQPHPQTDPPPTPPPLLPPTPHLGTQTDAPPDAPPRTPPAASPTGDAGISGETNLFIRPDAGFTFRYTDALMTNFHLPRSTLLAMVAALPGVGLPRLMAWYREAIARGYRFYSYGDAMLIV